MTYSPTIPDTLSRQEKLALLETREQLERSEGDRLQNPLTAEERNLLRVLRQRPGLTREQVRKHSVRATAETLRGLDLRLAALGTHPRILDGVIARGWEARSAASVAGDRGRRGELLTGPFIDGPA